MYKLQRKLLSQNFLHSQKLVSKLLGSSSIGKDDLVLDIGAGKGIITSYLSSKAREVIAIEIDPQWIQYLKRRFQHIHNIIIHKGDILTYELPKSSYKVFANIPFSIEGKIIRKLLDTGIPPEESYLVIKKELAYRLEAYYRDNMFSILHKPWFEFRIIYTFKNTDFTPTPNVKAVLLKITKRRKPLIPEEIKDDYQKLVITGYQNGLPIYRNLKNLYGRKRVAAAMKKLCLSRNMKPNILTLKHWINLYFLLCR